MGNIVILLSLVYEQQCNNQATITRNTSVQKKIKQKMLILLFMMGISLIILMFNTLKKGNNIVSLVSIIVYIISAIILMKYSDRQWLKNCEDNRYNYYARLNLLKNKMNTDFNVYSKTKVIKLIDECEKAIDEINSRYKIMRRFKEIWRGILAPVVGFISGLVVSVENLSKSLNWITLISGLITISLIILFIFGVLWGMESFANMTVKEERRRIIQLKTALNDIYLKNFI